MPMLRSAPGLRFITAPPPRCVSMYTACGGISATSACHSPDVAFDPNHGLPMARTIGAPSYVVNPFADGIPDSVAKSGQNENCCEPSLAVDPHPDPRIQFAPCARRTDWT